ncbi:RNA 2',3'-cyclic phosphodiesterase [Geothrix sp.]|uniref:RNA 2',3'-cyclic phosphodiesterase n=1 Tax=Geothrix sp. TaxID=1962974 RepID=UPI0025C4C111|nr:RNA 2',3'-cyclic phosphodiesterase [Geothrix sp.]
MEVGRRRLFFALPLLPPLQEALGRWQSLLPGDAGEGAMAGARWCRPEGLHLTLAFLGECAEEALPHLGAVGEAVAGRRKAFLLRTAGLGGFPSFGAARVLWLGLEPSPALEALAADLRHTLGAAGDPFEAPPFRAHLTLARFRQTRPLAGSTAPTPATFAADRFALFESRPQGCYAPLQVWHLQTV